MAIAAERKRNLIGRFPAQQCKNAARKLRLCRYRPVSPKSPVAGSVQHYEGAEMPNCDACLVAESIR
jgi:hypothetical protein